MQAIPQELPPNLCNEHLRFGFAPLQNAREIRQADGFDGIKHLRL
jgi:hypothetical protein